MSLHLKRSGNRETERRPGGSGGIKVLSFHIERRTRGHVDLQLLPHGRGSISGFQLGPRLF